MNLRNYGKVTSIWERQITNRDYVHDRTERKLNSGNACSEYSFLNRNIKNVRKNLTLLFRPYQKYLLMLSYLAPPCERVNNSSKYAQPLFTR
jgi:hypothetical protein